MIEFDLNEEQGKGASSYKDSAESCGYCLAILAVIAVGCVLYQAADCAVMNFHF